MDPYTRRFTWDLIRARTAAAPPRGSSSPSITNMYAAGSSSPSQPSAQPSAGGARRPPAIILTTHSMEEAEALADDVVVMAGGRVAAIGTPLQLKQRYGAGYTLTISLDERPLLSPRSDDGRLSPAGSPGPAVPDPRSAVVELTCLVKRLVPLSIPLKATGVAAAAAPTPGAPPVATASGEVSFRLPKECAAQFPALLRELQARGPGLGASSYGLSETTLEEVFHAITSEAASHQSLQGRIAGPAAAAGSAPQQQNSEQAEPLPPSLSLSLRSWQKGSYSSSPSLMSWQKGSYSSNCAPASDGPAPRHLVGAALTWQRLRALVGKRALLASRDRLAVLTQLLVPLLLVCLALWVQNLAVRSPAQPLLVLGRGGALRGAAGVAGASEAARGQQGGLPLAYLLQGYGSLAGSGGSAMVDSGRTSLWAAGDVRRTESLEGWLLDHWHSGRPAYDALFVQQMPGGVVQGPLPGGGVEGLQLGGDPGNDSPKGQIMGVGPSLEGMQLVLLVNQTAVHALPAALNQASTALLR